MDGIRPDARDHRGEDHAGKGHDPVHAGEPGAAIRVLDAVAQHQVRRVGQPHHRRRRQARVPRPPRVPDRPRPHHPADDVEAAEHQPDLNRGERQGIPALLAAGQVQGAGHRPDQIGQRATHKRAQVHIEDTLYMPLRVGRRVEKRQQCGDDEHQHRQDGHPGQQAAWASRRISEGHGWLLSVSPPLILPPQNRRAHTPAPAGSGRRRRASAARRSSLPAVRRSGWPCWPARR